MPVVLTAAQVRERRAAVTMLGSTLMSPASCGESPPASPVKAPPPQHHQQLLQHRQQLRASAAVRARRPRGVFCETAFGDTRTETNDEDMLGGPAHPIPVVSFGPSSAKGVETVGRFRVCDFPSPKIDSEFHFALR